MSLSRRASRFLIIAAHIAVLGLVFQIGAFEHWGPHPLDVYGVEGSTTHVHTDHCHGDSATCGGAGGATVGAVAGASSTGLPKPAFLKMTLQPVARDVVENAFLGLPFQPPRSA